MTPPGGPCVVRLTGVRVAYGARTALQGIDLEVPAGQFLALTGPNGSGKSTLLGAALGLVPTAEGKVELFGVDLARLTIRERARTVAWVPQIEALREDVPLLRYVLYGRYAVQGPFGWERPADHHLATTLLREVGLGDRLSDGVLSLSGGERQRATLARALAQQAPLLLLDEPTSHLDIGHQLDLLTRVRSLVRNRGLTVVAALHDLNLAARFADRIVVLARGRRVADGTPSAVLSSELLARVWGVDAELRHEPASGLPYLLPRLPPREGLPPKASGVGPRVHVVAGGGSGAALLRRLVDEGFDVTAGVLPLFDTDATTAEELGVALVAELPFAPIGPEALARLDGLLRDARAAVVAPFPVGPTNLANLERLTAFVRAKPLVLLAQPAGERWDYTDGAATELRGRLIADGAGEVPDPVAAVAWLSARLGPGAPAPASEGEQVDPQRA